MYIHSDPDIAAAVAKAIDAEERDIRVDIWVDWLRDGTFGGPLDNLTNGLHEVTVDNVVTDRALTGTAPEELMLIEGSAAAELSFDVSGRYQTDSGKTIPYAAVFSPYNGLSPFYNTNPIGAEIFYNIGIETPLGVIWFQQFIGNVRTIGVVRGDNVVHITALDRAEFLRRPVELPPWGQSQFQSQRGWSEGQLMYSSWAIDHALRFCDVSTTPIRPITFEERKNPSLGNVYGSPDWGMQLWVSGNGSYTTSIGYIDNVQDQGFPQTEVNDVELTRQFGEPHPNVASIAIEEGRRPQNLHGLGADNSGLRPTFYANHPLDERNRSFFKQYRARDKRSLYPLSGANWFGFTLITNGDNGSWHTGHTWFPMQIFLNRERADGSPGLWAEIEISNGSVRLRLRMPDATTPLSDSPWFVIPGGQDSVDIHAKLQMGSAGPGSTRAALRVNDVQVWSTSTWPQYNGPTNFYEHNGLVRIKHLQGMQDIFWANRYITVATTTNPITGSGLNQFEEYAYRKAKYGAILDKGLNRLTHIPDIKDQDAWSLSSSVAAAEFGSVFWDEHGRFRFWNRETMLAKQATPVKTVNLDKAVDLGIETSLDSVRNEVVAEATVGNVVNGVVFEAEDPDRFYIPDGTRTRFVIEAENIVSVRSHTLTVVGHAGFTDGANHVIVIEQEDSPEVWDEFVPAVWDEDYKPVAYLDENRNLVLEIVGVGFGDWRVAKIRVQGQVLDADETLNEVARDESSIADYGIRSYPINGDWVQNQPDVVKNLTQWTLERTARPIPTTDRITVSGDPRIQLGDTIQLLDPDGLGEEMLLQILGINRSFTADEGLVDQLTVEMIRPANIGFWDSAQYGLWDSTFIWSD